MINKTTIVISRKLLEVIKEDGVMGDSYEDVLWKWKNKITEMRLRLNYEKEKQNKV